MRLLPALILPLVACSSSDDKWTEPTTDKNPTDTGDTDPGDSDSGDTDTDTDTGEVDTGDGPEVLLPKEGQWGFAKPNLVSDPCGINDYQDVTEFVPAQTSLSDSTETGFVLDGNTACDRTDLNFECASIDVSEDALGGTATLIIDSTTSGLIVSDSSLSVDMNVNITECQGAGCALIELALTFPCAVELSTQATAL